MQCPQCKRVYRRNDFGRDESYFECDSCGTELVEGGDEGPSSPFSSSPIQGDSTKGGSFVYSTLAITPTPATARNETTAGEVAQSYDVSILIRRWIARMVDGFIVVAGLLVLVLMLGQLADLGSIWAVPLFAIPLAYFGILEGRFGQTPGKRLLDLRVTDLEGNTPGIGRGLARNLLAVVDFNPLFGGLLGALVAFLSKRRQRLGDMVAGTVVVRDEDWVRTSIQS